MGISDPAFPASAAFDQIQEGLAKSDADRQDAIKKGGAIFAFTLKNKEGKEGSWYLDLKSKGEVGRGLAPEGQKPAGMSMILQSQEKKMAFHDDEFRSNTCVFFLVTLVLADEDFGKLVAGSAKAQSLFMGGKLKIKGDMMKATKLEPILGSARAKL